MEKIKSLIIAALAIVILGAFFISTAFASDSTGFSLALSSNQIQYKIPAGTMFNGTVATSGWVRVWVTEPSGGEIVNLGIIEKTTSFGFIAQQNGTYTFNFENDLPNTITVTFTYTSNPQLPDTNCRNTTNIHNLRRNCSRRWKPSDILRDSAQNQKSDGCLQKSRIC